MIILSSLCILPLAAQNFEKTKTSSETYYLSKDMAVKVQNKYGDIQIVNWEKDSVKITTNIEVRSNKQSKVDKIFNSIKMDFKHNHFYIIAKTEFLGQNGFWTDVSDISKTIFNSNTTTQVDYIVHIPNHVKLSIVNKYGDVYLGDYSGILDIDVSNGDLNAHNLLGKSEIKISFGDLFVQSLGRTKLEFSNVEAQVDDCDYMETKTRGSKLYINHVNELNISSGHDKYYLDHVNKIYGNSKYSYLKIANLHSNADLIYKYGALHFKNLSDDIDHFYLETYKTEIHLNLILENAYVLNFKSIKSPDIRYPLEGFKKKETIIDSILNLKNTQLIWGDLITKKSIPFNIRAEEGNVFIKIN